MASKKILNDLINPYSFDDIYKILCFAKKFPVLWKPTVNTYTENIDTNIYMENMNTCMKNNPVVKYYKNI